MFRILHRGTTTAYQAILANKPLSFIYLDKHVKKIHLNKPFNERVKDY